MNPEFSKQVSVSPLVWVTAAVLGGVVFASVFSLSLQVWLGLAGLSLVATVILVLRRGKVRFVLLLLPLFFFLGAARYQYSLPEKSRDTISFYNDLQRQVYVSGTISEPPDVRDTYINLRIDVSAIDIGQGDLPASGLILVRLYNPQPLEYGQRLRVRGHLVTPKQTAGFSYRDYLLRQGIYSILDTSHVTILPGYIRDPYWAFVYRVQNSLYKRVHGLYPDPEAGLMAGILLGQDQSLPPNVKQAFRDTGTAHIIAISGFNIAIVSMVLILIFGGLLGRKWGTGLAILGIVAYTVLVGAEPSVVRAAIIGTMTLVGAMVGRRNLAATGLSSAALLMVLFNPMVLWDVSFQLSFAATLGLIIYTLPLQDVVAGMLARFIPAKIVDRVVYSAASYLFLTLAAQLTTLPVIFYHFGRISLSSFIANPLVLPAQPPLMILGGLSVVLGKLYAPAGALMAALAWPFAAYTIRVVELIAELPGGVFTLGEFGLIAGCFFYAALFGLTYFWKNVRSFASAGLVVTVLVALTFLTWRSVYALPDGRLHVVFFNVGTADGILVTTPSGRSILINGGDSPTNLADQLGRRIPPFSGKIDMLVVASTQENQVAALPQVIDQYRPGRVLWSGNEQASYSSLQLLESVISSRIPLGFAEAEQQYALGDGVLLRVLATSTRGAVLSLEMGSFRALLPVGVTFDVFKGLKDGEGLGPVSVLLLSDSGYGPSNPEAWLENINPHAVVLSVAADDPDGLPADEVIAPYKNYNLLRTDRLGWIELVSDGKLLWTGSQHEELRQIP